MPPVECKPGIAERFGELVELGKSYAEDVGLIVGSPAVDAWRPLIALVAASPASAGSWQGWLPGTRSSQEPTK
jgi:hypothetical protein